MAATSLTRNLRRLTEPLAKCRVVSRHIIVPAGFKVEKTIGEVITSLSRDVIGEPRHYDPRSYHKMREALVSILPESQAELPPRRMVDSYDAVTIPLGSDKQLRDR